MSTSPTISYHNETKDQVIERLTEENLRLKKELKG